jgi:hypothetical protein
MPCITSENKADWTADLVSVRAQITAINLTLAGSSALSGVSEYTFDSGTGRQTEKFNSPQELIKTLELLIARREYLKRKLNGTDILISATRR